MVHFKYNNLKHIQIYFDLFDSKLLLLFQYLKLENIRIFYLYFDLIEQIQVNVYSLCFKYSSHYDRPIQSYPCWFHRMTNTVDQSIEMNFSQHLLLGQNLNWLLVRLV